MELKSQSDVDASVARRTGVGVGRNMLGSILIVLTAFFWIATWVLVACHDQSTGTEATVSLLLAVAFPVDVFLCFNSRVPASVVAFVTLALFLATVALAAAVWANRTHFVGATYAANLPTTNSPARFISATPELPITAPPRR